MGKKQYQKQIRSLEKAVRKHEEKIKAELSKPEPSYYLINHWHKEIENFTKSIQKSIKRLKR